MFHMNIFIIKGEREILFFFGKVSLISDRTLYVYVFFLIHDIHVFRV